MAAIAFYNGRPVFHGKRKKVRIAKRQPQHGGEIGRFRTRAEQPHFWHAPLTRSGMHCRKGMLRIQVITQIPQQIRNLLWEIADITRPSGIGQRRRREVITPWRPANTQINTARIQGLQQTKMLRHFERTIV